MSNRNEDPRDRRERIALFRHAIIGELDVETFDRGELSARLEELAGRDYRHPDDHEVCYSTRTLWSWWSTYKRDGLAGLLPKERCDKGALRALDREVLEEAIRLRKEIPSRSTATILDILVREGRIPPGKVHRATLDRHLARSSASRRQMKTLGDKRRIRMLFSRPNQLWIGDYHEAPILWDPGNERFRTIHLAAFIDHYSKVVPHAQWYTNERLATLEDTLKKAFLARGLPEAIYVDNGKVFHARAFAFACDRFGIKLRHSRAYESEGRGAIERFNGTVVQQFEPEIRAMKIADLHEIDLRWIAWLEERYHLGRHEATKEAPIDRFAAPGFTPRFPDPVLLSETFRVRVKRKVHQKASTVEIEGVFFLVESFLRGHWVEVHFDPHRLDDVIVYLEGKRIQTAFPQKPNERPLPARESPMASTPPFDYLGSLRAEYDRRIVAEARKLSFAELVPAAGFALPAFLDLVAEYLGKTLAPYERDEVELAFNSVGPFSEATTRVALEHALRVRGRGLHVSIYTHYLKVFHLAALRANNRKEGSP